MKLKIIVLIVIVVSVLGNGKAFSSVNYLFDGSGSPLDKGWGWAVESGTGHLGGSVTITTQEDLFSVETFGAQYYYYTFDTRSLPSIISIKTSIHSASQNYADAGFIFSVFGTKEPWGISPDRINSFYITPDKIGFMNQASSYSIDATSFHEYAATYQNGTLQLFVDESYEDILNGLASPVLSRTGNFNNWGLVTFGDQTNDNGVNSSYTLDYVATDVAIVPEPISSILFVTGGTFLAGRRFIKKKKA